MIHTLLVSYHLCCHLWNTMKLKKKMDLCKFINYSPTHLALRVVRVVLTVTVPLLQKVPSVT